MYRLFITIFLCWLAIFNVVTIPAMCAQVGESGISEEALPEESLSEKTLDDIESQLLDQQKKIHRLQKGIEGHKDRVKGSREKEVSLLSELDKINRRLNEERKKLATLKQKLAKQEELILQKKKEMGRAYIEKETAKAHVQKRLNAFYRMGPVGMMNVIFSTDSLPDLLNIREYFQHIIQHDQKIIDEYRAKIERLTEAQHALNKEKDQLLVVIADVNKQEKQLKETRQDRMALLDRVKTEKKLYQRALMELQDAAEQLSAKMKMLEERHAAQLHNAASIEENPLRSPKKKRPGGLSDFAAQKGRLDPPVPGTVTTYFGKNTTGRFGIATYANGIDIKTEPGTEIKAVYDGKIVYAGTLRGYGNLIIIDHGHQYYSLVSRAAELFKKEGESVLAGESIGTMSDQEGLLSEGLHFEIRRGTEPENPLQWLNNAKLKIKATRKAN